MLRRGSAKFDNESRLQRESERDARQEHARRVWDFSQHPVLVSRSYLALRPIHSSLGPFAFLIFLGGTFILHERHTHPSERRAAKKRALRAKGDPASSMAVRRKIPNSSYSMARRMWEETLSFRSEPSRLTSGQRVLTRCVIAFVVLSDSFSRVVRL